MTAWPRRQQHPDILEVRRCLPREQRHAIREKRQGRILASIGSRSSHPQRKRPVDLPIEPRQTDGHLLTGPRERQAGGGIALHGIHAGHEPRRVDVEADVDARLQPVEQDEPDHAGERTESRGRERSSEGAAHAAATACS